MRYNDLTLSPTGLWFQGRKYPCTIGRSGLTSDKREGDMATPRGTHSIVGMLYRPDRIAKPTFWAEPIGLGDLWSDDPEAPDYNHFVKAPYKYSHEALRRSAPVYDLILLTDWNWPDAKPGKGSAIFIHQWRRPVFPTAGCVALKRADLHDIAPRINIGTRLVIR